jgi:hypothetical protein
VGRNCRLGNHLAALCPLRQSLAIANANVLRASAGVMYQRSTAAWAPRIKCPFKCVQNEVCSHRRTDAPTDNPPGEHVDHEGHIEPALPRRDIGEIKNPELVWPVCPELPVDPIQRARSRRIGNGRANTFASQCSEPPRYAPGSSASRLYPLRRPACWLARHAGFPAAGVHRVSHERSGATEREAVRHSAGSPTGQSARPCRSA